MESSPSADADGVHRSDAGPVRTCAGCRRRDGKARLVRMVADGAGRLKIDRRGREPGRGVYVHAERRCVEQLLRTGAAERSLRRKIVNSAELSPALWLDRPIRDDVSRSVE